MGSARRRRRCVAFDPLVALTARSSPLHRSTWVLSLSRSWLNPTQENPMLDSYFCAPKTLGRLRAGPSAVYIVVDDNYLGQDS